MNKCSSMCIAIIHYGQAARKSVYLLPEFGQCPWHAAQDMRSRLRSGSFNPLPPCIRLAGGLQTQRAIFRFDSGS